MKKEIFYEFLKPLLILIILTIIISITHLDLTIERLFYFGEQGGWIYHDRNPWIFLYNYSPYPAIILSCLSLFIFIGSFFKKKIIKYRKITVFFVILILLGPGLLVHVVLKDHWGRPRPVQLLEFNGKDQYRYYYVWERGIPGDGFSFPSGHAATAFFMISPFFIFRKNNRKKAKYILGAGIFYGSIVGLGRMVQGKHFLTDIIWSAGFIYLCGLLLYYLLGFHKDPFYTEK